MNRSRTKKSSKNRKGAAVAELAICLPAIVLLVFGAIECTSMIFLRQSVTISAYEGIRVAIRGDSTNAEVEARCNQILAERNINGASITIAPGNLNGIDRGEPVTVSVSAPSDANNILPLQFFTGAELRGNATMIKE